MDTALRIHAVKPRGRTITCALMGDSDLSRSAGGGGWQIVDRPRRAASTQWLDYSPYVLTMTLMLDGVSDRPFKSPRSVEHDIAVVESWEVPGHGRIQPPILKVSGPVPHTDLQWVVRSLDWKEAIRHPHSGHRLQQTVDVVLLEYVPATILVTGSSPAKAAHHRQATSGSASTRKYTVRSGDTLSAIAARELGAAKRWPEISTLNHLRDPNMIRVGQVLLIPPA